MLFLRLFMYIIIGVQLYWMFYGQLLPIFIAHAHKRGGLNFEL